jgi:DNA repair photolyase
LRGRLARLWDEKVRVAERLRSLLGEEGAARARGDHHARRPPRPCGITIHTGIGCSMGCLYCYVPDMGFPMRPRPYPLTPLQMAYALAVNPYVLPRATLAAYGSVTEPFLPETRERALGYIREVHRWLRLPSQVSTKSILDPELAGRLAEAEPAISVLVTVVALREWARRLEPGAPPAEERIEAAGRAARRGLHVALFVRPIIPGVTDRQAREIFELAAEAGIRYVVLGTLRVTPGILRRLAAAGVDVGLIESRLPRPPRGPRDQVAIRAGDIKRAVAGEAERAGLRVLPAACSHNIVSHGGYCEACRLGPCGDPSRAARYEPGEVEELLEAAGIRARVRLSRGAYLVRVAGGRDATRRARALLEAALRARVEVRAGDRNF